MDLIKLNSYTPPSPSSYEVRFSDVNGEQTQTEDGKTYIEQVRAEVPEVKVGWTNISYEDAVAITNQTANAVVNAQFFYGTMRSASMTVSERSLKLKLVNADGSSFWDLSFTLNG